MLQFKVLFDYTKFAQNLDKAFFILIFLGVGDGVWHVAKKIDDIRYFKRVQND